MFLFVRENQTKRDGTLPLFLITDKIAASHRTVLTILNGSSLKADQLELNNFTQDYSSLWAHLNHLYNTNDVKAGKEYYTESWYRQICNNDLPLTNRIIHRKDVSHQVTITSWMKDGLVCTISDTVVFDYTYDHNYTHRSKSTIAMALLFQGDHWRVDAIRILK